VLPMPSSVVSLNNLTTADFRKNLFDAGSPYEGFGLPFVFGHILLNRCDQLVNAVEAAATNPLVREVAEPALNQIQPGRTVGTKCK